MRWNYRTPEPQEIVIDRGKLWQYVPVDNQVVIQGFDAARVEYTFLTGLGNLERDFRIAWARPDRRPADPLRYLALEPRDEQATFAKVTLGVEPGGHRVIVTEVTDLFGNKTAIRFEGLRDNVGVDPGMFVFRAPKGADVIDMTSPAGRGR
jgi:outer membrane lipoprotein carrier protein